MADGVEAAHDRLLATVRSGDWERVPEQIDAYGAAVRADERRRAIEDVASSIKAVFGDDPDEPLADLRARCLGALDRAR